MSCVQRHMACQYDVVPKSYPAFDVFPKTKWTILILCLPRGTFASACRAHPPLGSRGARVPLGMLQNCLSAAVILKVPLGKRFQLPDAAWRHDLEIKVPLVAAARLAHSKGGSIAIGGGKVLTALEAPTSPDYAPFLSIKMISIIKNSRTSKISNF